MPAGAILYVGDDICHRVAVMESAGITVLRTECSVSGVRSSFASGRIFSAVTFHNDLVPPRESVVTTARELSRTPLILFKNPGIDCEDWLFDLIISVPTPPEVWSKSLQQAIKDARSVQEYSRQLRQECADARNVSRNLQEMAIRNRLNPVDYDALFRSNADRPAADPDDVDS